METAVSSGTKPFRRRTRTPSSSGYTAGYAASAGLVLLQASLYTAAVAKRWASAVFAAMLARLFGFVCILLGLEAYSLPVGTAAFFIAISALMAATGKLDWMAGASPSRG